MLYRIIAFLLILLLPTSLFAASLTPQEFRLKFQKAIEDESLCLEFISDLDNIEQEDYMYRAYRAAAIMSLAKFTSFPTDKLRYFYRGKLDIELAIERMPNNVELRFLRLAIQDFIPGFLFYNNQNEDLAFLWNNIDNIDEAFYVREVKNYLVHMGHIRANDLLTMR